MDAAARPAPETDGRLGPRRIDALIDADRLETLYGNTPQALPAGAAFAALLAWALAESASPAMVLGWLLLKWLVIGVRALDWWQFHRSPDRRRHVRHWSRRHALGAVTDGLGWGLLWPLFIPTGQAATDGLVLAGLVGVASVGVFTLSASVAHAMRFMGCTLLPVALQELLQPRGVVSWVTVGGVLVYGAVLWAETRRVSHQKDELLRLRFELAEIAAERERARRRAEDASAAKSRFLATVSHELRTPLNGILGTAELLAREPDDGQDRRQRLEVLRQSGAHLLGLIDDLLDISRIEAGRFELHPEPTPLRPLLDSVCALLQPLADVRGLSLGHQIDPTVPAAVMADAPRVRQVLLNLLGNALKFTDQGEVALHLVHDAGLLRFSVRDSGRGIPPERLGAIFEAFERVETAGQVTGTGLGLTISRQLARAMGGDLYAHSRPGEGSVFTFTLKAPGVAWSAPAPAPTASAPAAPASLQGEVLLVEDNPVNAMVARGMLEHLGLQVRSAEDGEQALAEMQRLRPDLVLMDCQMPHLDGWQATRRWRALEQAGTSPRLPIVALTANVVQGDRERCLAAGMDGYLPKPIDPTRLAEVLQRHLRGAP